MALIRMLGSEVLGVALFGGMADSWPRPEASTTPAVCHARGNAARSVSRLVLAGGLRDA
jgi:hypothetical protein